MRVFFDSYNEGLLQTLKEGYVLVHTTIGHVHLKLDILLLIVQTNTLNKARTIR